MVTKSIARKSKCYYHLVPKKRKFLFWEKETKELIAKMQQTPNNTTPTSPNTSTDSIEFYGVKFFFRLRGTDQQKGLINSLSEEGIRDGLIIARDFYGHVNRITKSFAYFESIKSFMEWMFKVPEHLRNFYEVMVDDGEFTVASWKPFVDIDMFTSHPYFAKAKGQKAAIDEIAKQFALHTAINMATVFDEVYGIKMQPGDIQIFKSQYAPGEGNLPGLPPISHSKKRSFHVMVRNYSLGGRLAAEEFMRLVRSRSTCPDFIDNSIYTKNRCIMTVYSRKLKIMESKTLNEAKVPFWFDQNPALLEAYPFLKGTVVAGSRSSLRAFFPTCFLSDECKYVRALEDDYKWGFEEPHADKALAQPIEEPAIQKEDPKEAETAPPVVNVTVPTPPVEDVAAPEEKPTPPVPVEPVHEEVVTMTVVTETVVVTPPAPVVNATAPEVKPETPKPVPAEPLDPAAANLAPVLDVQHAPPQQQPDAAPAPIGGFEAATAFGLGAPPKPVGGFGGATSTIGGFNLEQAQQFQPTAAPQPVVLGNLGGLTSIAN